MIDEEDVIDEEQGIVEEQGIIRGGTANSDEQHMACEVPGP